MKVWFQVSIFVVLGLMSSLASAKTIWEAYREQARGFDDQMLVSELNTRAVWWAGFTPSHLIEEAKERQQKNVPSLIKFIVATTENLRTNQRIYSAAFREVLSEIPLVIERNAKDQKSPILSKEEATQLLYFYVSLANLETREEQNFSGILRLRLHAAFKMYLFNKKLSLDAAELMAHHGFGDAPLGERGLELEETERQKGFNRQRETPSGNQPPPHMPWLNPKKEQAI